MVGMKKRIIEKQISGMTFIDANSKKIKQVIN